jgi:hypothetical protein
MIIFGIYFEYFILTITENMISPYQLSKQLQSIMLNIRYGFKDITIEQLKDIHTTPLDKDMFTVDICEKIKDKLLIVTLYIMLGSFNEATNVMQSIKEVVDQRCVSTMTRLYNGCWQTQSKLPASIKTALRKY